MYLEKLKLWTWNKKKVFIWSSFKLVLLSKLGPLALTQCVPAFFGFDFPHSEIITHVSECVWDFHQICGYDIDSTKFSNDALKTVKGAICVT